MGNFSMAAVKFCLKRGALKLTPSRNCASRHFLQRHVTFCSSMSNNTLKQNRWRMGDNNDGCGLGFIL